ncbi:MAG: AAA family ATPase [Candidatus Aminicenantes bacterium]
MIIKYLKAENILKYSNLEIKDLPDKGLIGISGLNESGKTTVGEIICFCFYGRTYSLKKDETARIIKWDEPRGMVQMDFSINGDTYQVIRYVDDEGNHGARLSKVEEKTILLAKGAERVNEQIFEISGIAYEEFIESIYLAQRETMTPYPHSDIIKKMAGTDTLESVYKEILKSREKQESEWDETLERIQNTGQNLEDLHFEEKRLEELNDSHKAAKEKHSKVQENLKEFESALDKYDENWPKIKKLKKRFKGFLFPAILFFILGAAVWASWVLINSASLPDFSQRLELFYSSWVPGWGEYLILLPAAFVITGIFLIFIILDIIVFTKKRRRERESKVLADCLEVIYKDYQASQKDTASNEEEESTPQDMQKAVSLIDKIKSLEVTPAQVKKPAREVFAYLEWAVREGEAHLSEIESEIEEEKRKQQRVNELRNIKDDLMTKEESQKKRLKIQKTALDLLEGAIHYLSKNFNREIIRLAGKTLPLFTEGRYSHIQIDENFSVKIFSNEKHDFMNFDEASSGTRQQIMLALRLAFSHELVEKAKGKIQFIFLDEPFAFFDDARIKGALKALPDFSKKVRQIWIASQGFPEDLSFGVHLKCHRDEEELVVKAQ